MKIDININEKIGQPNYGSFGSACTIQLDLDQAELKQPSDVLAKIAFAADIARAAVNRELDLQRRHGQSAQAPAREPGDDDNGLGPGDPAYDRNNGGARRDDREDRPRERYDDRGGRPPERGRGEYRDDRRGGGGNRNGRSGGGGSGDREPRTGKQLYGWANDRDAVKWFIQFGQAEGFGARLNDWHEDDVAFAL
jgi:hypothetical protein